MRTCCLPKFVGCYLEDSNVVDKAIINDSFSWYVSLGALYNSYQPKVCKLVIIVGPFWQKLEIAQLDILGGSDLSRKERCWRPGKYPFTEDEAQQLNSFLSQHWPVSWLSSMPLLLRMWSRDQEQRQHHPRSSTGRTSQAHLRYWNGFISTLECENWQVSPAPPPCTRSLAFSAH